MEEATKLRCRNDHWELAAWQIRGAPYGRGFYIYVTCELGDHYLAPGGYQLEPYVWPDNRTAWAAVDGWNREHQY